MPRQKSKRRISGRVSEYRFKIDAYSPDTMPLNRLAEYLKDLSVLFGESQSVHLVKIGGEEDPVPVHLEGRQQGQVYICRASRNMAKDLAQHLFTTCLRVEGMARWIRHRNGEWEMRRFTIKSFEPLKETTLRETIED